MLVVKLDEPISVLKETSSVSFHFFTVKMDFGFDIVHVTPAALHELSIIHIICLI